MNTNHFKKQIGGFLTILLCAAVQVYAGGGGGGGGGGGRGGGGGGGAGGGAGGGGGFGGGGAALGAVGGGGGGGGARGGGGGASAGNSSYNGNGLVGTAQISVDPNTHNLIIIADPITMEQIRQVLASLDAPEPQVNIKVCFLEVDDSAALDIGFEGNYNGASSSFGLITSYITNYSLIPGTATTVTSGGNTQTTYGPASIGPSALTPLTTSYNINQGFGLPASLPGAGGNGGIYQVMSTDFTGTLQAIATKGKARVLSRPMIMARDGQLAEIVVGQSVYLPSSVSLTSVGGTGTTVPEINGSYQNVGIQLDVTPFIGINGLITLILQPQITSIDTSTPGQVIQGGSLLSSAVYAPNLNKRSANTVVVTPDGRPIVIGGLMSSDKASSETKVPLLGDIPVLGNLFKFSSHSNAKNELLIFLTPHIIQSPEALPDMSTHEMSQMTLLTNSVTSLELDRVLDGIPVKK